MLRGLCKLTWLETKIFLREPLGVIGTVGFPILLFLLMRRMGRGAPRNSLPPLLAGDLPVLAAVMVSLSAVVSLVAIIAIYREGGILKRLRATPLQPVTILLAHVIVKLGFTALSLGVLVLAGARSFGPAGGVARSLSFAVALLFTTLCLLSIGFIIASLVPTARFAQPLATLVVYTMLGFSGLFVSLDRMPAGMQVLARLLPMSHAVSLLRGIWHGEGWLAHAPEAGILAVDVPGVHGAGVAGVPLGVIATSPRRATARPTRPARRRRPRPAAGRPRHRRSDQRRRPWTPHGSTRTRCADGSTRTSTKLWKNGASLESNSADSHSAVNGHAPSSRVHHHAGRFHHGVDAFDLGVHVVVPRVVRPGRRGRLRRPRQRGAEAQIGPAAAVDPVMHHRRGAWRRTLGVVLEIVRVAGHHDRRRRAPAAGHESRQSRSGRRLPDRRGTRRRRRTDGRARPS